MGLHHFEFEKRWVAWRWEERNGKKTKVPIQPDGTMASSIHPRTWVTRAEAEKAPGAAGVGIVFTGDGLGGIDLDDCRDKETGYLDAWAQEIVDRFDSYTEVSPSGTGVKIFVEGAPESLPGHKLKPEGARGHADVFTDDRFFTVTGEGLESTPDEVVDAGELGGPWDWLAEKLRSSGNVATETFEVDADVASLTPADAALVDAIQKRGLSRYRWRNGADDPTDRSACDFALAAAMNDDGFLHEEIGRALLAYDKGQIGSGALSQSETERQINRILSKLKPNDPPPRIDGEDWDLDVDTPLYRPETDGTPAPVEAEPVATLEEMRVGTMLEELPPEREWLLTNRLPQNVCGLIAAPGGTGKSFAVLDLAMSVAGGDKWMGMDVEENGGALVVSAEDDIDEVHRRIHAIARAREEAGMQTDPDLVRDDLYILPTAGLDNRFTAVQGGEIHSTEWLRRVTATARQIPNLKLVILDPLSRFQGGEPNSADSGTRIVEAVEYMRNELGCTILMPAHTRKGGSRDGQDGVRGSSAIVDGMRFVGALRVLDGDEAREEGFVNAAPKEYLWFEVHKSSYAEPAPRVLLRRLPGGGLAPVPNAVPEPQLANPGAYRGPETEGGQWSEEDRDDLTHILEVVCEQEATATKWIEVPMLRKRLGLSKRRAHDLIRRGLECGYLGKDENGNLGPGASGEIM